MRPNSLGGVTLENLAEVGVLQEAFAVVSNDMHMKASCLTGAINVLGSVSEVSIIDASTTYQEIELKPDAAIIGLFVLRYCLTSRTTPIGLILRASKTLENFVLNGGQIPIEVDTRFATVHTSRNTITKPAVRREY
jgi:hypothetical protein